MRFGPHDKFWVVTDPDQHSELADIHFEASLADLQLQFRGGLTIDRNPTLFTDEQEAQIEAYGRLVAGRASRSIARAVAAGDVCAATRIELLDPHGKVVFEAELEPPR